jgi:hypothetical protein
MGDFESLKTVGETLFRLELTSEVTISHTLSWDFPFNVQEYFDYLIGYLYRWANYRDWG